MEHRATPPGGSETIATLGYPANSNRVTQITQNATTVRSICYDAAGNITSDNRLGSTYAYTYNHANRLKTVSYEGNLSFLRCRFTPSLVRPDGRARTIGARAPTPTTASTS